jgi:hypothetical protein
MFTPHSQHLLNDREETLRRRAEDERKVRAERDRDDPDAMDAEIRLLIERTAAEPACECCEEEFEEAAG